MSPKPRSFLSSLIDTLASTAATELTEKLGAATGMSERSKATARRRIHKQMRDSMQGAAKKVKDKVASVRAGRGTGAMPPGIESVQFHTACVALGIGGMKYGGQVDGTLIRENKRAAAKLFHPDRVGNDSKREQLQVVLRAAEWLEAYNERLGKKKDG